jgi:O-antigen/teichoic acid export membrane protein
MPETRRRSEARTPMGRHSRPVRGARLRSGAAAIAAQGSQSLGSLVLQILAARGLGAEGLGKFGLLYGTLVVATAIATGFVGDSMTVLDRAQAPIRAALQSWLGLIAMMCALTAVAISWGTGFVAWPTALAFGAATLVFLFEDAVRRLLMANLKFWRIVIVDVASLVGVLALLFAVPGISLTELFVALTVGQVLAAVVGIAILPAHERWLAAPLPAEFAAVARYGGYRGLQQAVRPTLLSLVRLMVIAIVGLAAAGELEAARVYAAPALLAVAGVNSFLFANYAKEATKPMAYALREADRGVLLLVVIIAVLSVGAVVAMPVLAPLLVGGEYALSTVAVAGWLAYTVSVAAVSPYGALAAVRGHQGAVLLIRILDSLLSLAVVAALVWGLRSAEWVPVGLTLGSLAGGLALRLSLLRSRTPSRRYGRETVH